MEKNVVVLVRQAGLGYVGPGNGDFAVTMFERFLHALESQPIKPSAICFYTEGVKLACRGSYVIPALQLIQGMGVRLLLCRSCLEQYGLIQDVAAGEIGTMHDIAGLLMEADQTISI